MSEYMKLVEFLHHALHQSGSCQWLSICPPVVSEPLTLTDQHRHERSNSGAQIRAPVGPFNKSGACQSWWCPAESFPDGPGCRRTDGFTPRLLTACHQLQPHCTPCSSACLYLLLSCCWLFSSVPMNENISLSHTSHSSAEGLWHASNTRRDWEKLHLNYTHSHTKASAVRT